MLGILYDGIGVDGLRGILYGGHVYVSIELYAVTTLTMPAELPATSLSSFQTSTLSWIEIQNHSSCRETTYDLGASPDEVVSVKVTSFCYSPSVVNMNKNQE